MNNTQMINNANVTGAHTVDESGNSTLTIQVNDQHEHTFLATSRVSKALTTASVDDVVSHLDSGSYFFVGDEMVDFRYGDYNGFQHSQEAINKLVDVVGITYSDSELDGVNRNTSSRNIKLGREWDAQEFQIANLGAGDFKTAVHFGWSPFSQNVNSAFVLWRLICENGMRGTTQFLNSKIPLVNDWENHLAIANQQLMNKINAKMTERILGLAQNRASVADCLLISKHVQDRSDALHNSINNEAAARLNMIGALVNPALHLKDVYKDEVFVDGSMAAMAPAHITGYDMFNMITEIRTHTEATAGSSGQALDLVANQMLFGGKLYGGHTVNKNVEQTLAGTQAPKLIINNPDQAFFGK